MSRTVVRALGAVSIALAILATAGCVMPEKREVERARAALEDCQAEHGRDEIECEPARLTLRDAQRRYEEAARKRWACDPTQEQCPTPR